LIAAFLFFILQYSFIAFQVYLTSYSTLYGSFAALPLFLIWLQAIWWIVFLGAEVAYQFQHGQYRFKARGEKNFKITYPAIALMLLQEASARFNEKRRPLSPEEFSNKHQLSYAVSSNLFQQLEGAGILVRILSEDGRRNFFQPGVPLEQTLVSEMLQAIAPQIGDKIDILESESAIKAEESWKEAFAKAEKVPLSS